MHVLPADSVANCSQIPLYIDIITLFYRNTTPTLESFLLTYSITVTWQWRVGDWPVCGEWIALLISYWIHVQLLYCSIPSATAVAQLRSDSQLL